MDRSGYRNHTYFLFGHICLLLHHDTQSFGLRCTMKQCSEWRWREAMKKQSRGLSWELYQDNSQKSKIFRNVDCRDIVL
jgi:hypothetical protein